MNAQVSPAAARLFVLLREPRPEARAAGDAAWEEGRERWTNPHAEDTPEYHNWDAGWNDAKVRNK